MIIGIQVLGILFVLAMLYLTMLYWKRKEFSRFEFTFWVIVWLAAGIIALFPKIVNPVVVKLDFARGWDMIVAVALVIVIVLSFVSHAKANRTERRMTELVQRLAREK